MSHRLYRISLVATLAVAVVACTDDRADPVPMVPDQSVRTHENVPVMINCTTGATGFDVAAFTLSEIVVPAPQRAEQFHGAVLLVTPAAGFTGSFPVQWTLSDGRHEVVAHATVLVDPGN